MPVFTSTTIRNLAGSQYGFSGTRIEDLGAAEYTLVTVVADTSGSVHAFRHEINACIGSIVDACNRSARADNLLFRVVSFDDDVSEVHGFKPIPDCSPKDYKLKAGGCTALYDASTNAVRALTAYGQDLTDHDFDVNGIVFVITDGGDNASTETVASVKDAFSQAVSTEAMESMVSVLVGVNISDAAISGYLMDFSARAGFDQYVEIENANTATLAKLADFASRSIASQSSALGTGAASTQLTF